MEDTTSTILVVDDNQTNLSVLFEMFQDTDYEVLFATDGKRAVELADSELPDLILLDVLMPEMDGFEVCRLLKQKEKTSQIPIIFMTALSDPQHKVKGFGVGAVDYVTKPFDQSEVLARVQTHLTIQTLRQELEEKNQTLKIKNDQLKIALEREKEIHELKTRFFSAASHEFRTPLTAIMTAGGMLKSYHDRLTAETRTKHINQIEQSVREITIMLDKILTYSKPDITTNNFIPASFNVKQFCQNIIEESKNTLQSKHQISLLYSIDSTYLNLDPNVLKQILSQLLSNAIKFSTPESAIELKIEQKNSTILFAIKDDGIGIPENELPHVFEPFFRGKKADSCAGNGLGLSIVKQFISLHRGTIRLESQENRGTTVYVELPLQDHHSNEQVNSN